MARPRTPTNILEMRGAFKNQRGRKEARANEPIVYEPLGEPPTTFNEQELTGWNDIVRTAPAGVLTEADRLAVETAARLLARERAGMNTPAEGRRFDSFLSKFGMTPSDRSRVSVAVPTTKPGNRFADIG